MQRKLILFTWGLLLMTLVNAQVSGIVFRDFNGDGTRQNTSTRNDPGVTGITVTATLASGTSFTTTTNASGAYSFSAVDVPSGTSARIEFQLPSSMPYMEFSQSGGVYGSAIQFVVAPSTIVNCAMNIPKDYVSSDTVQYVFPQMYGQSFPSPSTSYHAPQSVLRMFKELIGNGNNLNQVDSLPTPLSQLGGIWGIAFHKKSNTIYAASFFRVFAGFGVSGQSAIYKVKPGPDGVFATSDDIVSTFLNLDSYFGANSTGPDPFATIPKGDSSFVAKVSFGDIEISPDGNTLYAMNLYDRKIYSIPLNYEGIAPALGTITASPVFPSFATCTGTTRPFAMTVRSTDGKIFCGSTCETNSGLMQVYGYNPNTNTWDSSPSASWDYDSFYPNTAYCCFDNWNNSNYESGILATGLDINPLDNSLVFTYILRDLWASLPSAYRHIGNVLKLGWNGTGWDLENNAVVNGVTGIGPNNNQGPGGGEFYFDTGADGAEVSPLGAVDQIPGRNFVTSTLDDPYSVYSAGINYLNNTTGDTVGRKLVAYPGIPYPPPLSEFDGKKCPIGDIEYLGLVKPIEIGNRVWNDHDNDGIQDAGELPIQGVTVKLVSPGIDGIFGNVDDVIVATTTTDANGNYYFLHTTIDDPRRNANWTAYKATSILPSLDYQIRIDLGQSAINGTYQLSLSNVSSNTLDNIDNDGVNTTYLGTNYALTSFNTTKTTHSFDFGFSFTPVTGPTPTTCSINTTSMIASPIYANGNPLAGGTAANKDAFYWFNQNNIGEGVATADTIKASQIGTTWAVAYKTQNNTLYTSAFLKRHAGFGAGGPGAIYKIDLGASNPSATVFADLATMGVNVGTNPRSATVGPVDDANELPANSLDPNWDVNAYASVGKMSLGGMDVSTDGTKMYVMSLQDKELVELNISGASPAFTAKYTVPNPGCSNGDYIPWAVKYLNGKVYVGVVCTGETSQSTSDISATIYEFNAGTFTTVYSFPLNYPRGNVGGTNGYLLNPAEWKPWTSTFRTVNEEAPINRNDGVAIYPQAILSDIEFDTDGSIIVSLMDRNGHQTGGSNYKPVMGNTTMYSGQSAGDILRIGIVGGYYALENNASAGGTVATSTNCFGSPINGANLGQGPGNGEYYWSESYIYNPCQSQNTNTHDEISFGGLAFQAGSGEIALSAMNPTQTSTSGGVIWLSNTTGDRTHIPSGQYFNSTVSGYRLYYSTNPETFGKANGMGDIEYACVPNSTPGSVGNYVWTDTDGDGVQDAGETGINGVTVELWNATTNTLVSTTTTANNGTNDGAYNFVITASDNYYVKFPTTSGANVLTTQTATAATDGNSDASPTGQSPIFAIDIYGTGVAKDNMTIDAGYTPVSSCTLDPFSGLTAQILLGAPFNALTSTSSVLSNPAAMGGEIDVQMQLLAGSTSNQVVNYTGGALNVMNGTGATSRTILTYDGVDGNATTLNPTGLGGLDMSNNSNGFSFAYSGDGTPTSPKNVTATLKVYTDAANWSSQTINFLSGFGSTTLYFGRSGLSVGAGTGADFSNIGAVELTIESNADGLDYAISNFLTPCYPIGSVGNYVWSDTNADGVQDGSESGINGVTVELYKETAPGSGTYALAQTTNTANNGTNDGAYNFVITQSANYYVHFPTTNGSSVLSIQTETAATNGNSDAGESSGNSPVFAIDIYGVGTVKDNPTIDAGYITSQSLGNYVWLDEDKDGIQDAGEVGVSGVTVSLIKVSDNSTILTTSTDAFGYYAFRKIPATDYYVQFTLPVGYVFSPKGITSNSLDSDVNPSGSNVGKTDAVSLVSGVDNWDVDAGVYYAPRPTASLGNYVWLDSNTDGIQDANEKGVSDVVVELMDGTTVIGTTITNQEGYYKFTDLAPATYSVRFTLPVGYTFTQSGQGTVETGSDANATATGATFGQTSTVTLAAGDDNLTLDAGIVLADVLTASVGNYVWNDLNHDGIQDATERGVANVTVTLTDIRTNTVVGTRLTDEFGYYLFTNVSEGSYKLTFAKSGYTITMKDATNDNEDSDASIATGETVSFQVSHGDRQLQWDCGMYRTTPAGTASLGDYVWFDSDKDGIQDASEIGVSGVIATLYDATNTIKGKTATDKYGKYLFTDLDAGTYYVQFSNIPSDYAWTSQTSATTNGSDADVTGKTDSYTLATGTVHLDLDGGLILAPSGAGQASLGDKVWNDLNGDNVQDNNEPGIGEVLVTLYESDGVTVIKTTRTNSRGGYLFTNLSAGNYVVGFSTPLGFSPATANVGSNDGKDSDANTGTGKTAIITLAAGDNNLTVDAGFQNTSGNTARLGNYVWFDTDNNGAQFASEQGVRGVTASLYTSTGTFVATTTTDETGWYLFPNLAAGNYYVRFTNIPDGYTFTGKNLASGNDALDSDANEGGRTDVVSLAAGGTNLDVDAGLVSTRAAIGNYVWYDSNEDGVQNASEAPVSGVTVTLYNQTTNTKLAAAITDANGEYYFNNIPTGVTYALEFSNLPKGASFTQQNAGSATDFTDSDVNTSTGIISNITPLAGTTDYSFDAGIVVKCKASMQGFAWIDTDMNGTQDLATERPAAGVTVNLLDGMSQVIVSAVTDASGWYNFQNLLPGSYTVKFSTFPLGTTATTQNTTGTNLSDTDDSDANASGLAETFTLSCGDNVRSSDMGFKPWAGLGGYAFIDSIQDGVYDNGVEVIVPNLVVTLYDQNDVALRTTRTNENGWYVFRNLSPTVQYKVGFASLPGRNFTGIDYGSNDSTDSDVDAISGKTSLLSGLPFNGMLAHIDAGFLRVGGILPFELLSFTGQLIDNNGQLKWLTSQEVNSSHFVVERSTDNGKLFEHIGTVGASGNSNKAVEYHFTDYNIGHYNIDKVLYRLQMVDIDGTLKRSNTVELSIPKDDNIYVSMFPNPANNIVNLEYQFMGKRMAIVKVVNLLGQVMWESSVKEKVAPHQLSFDVSNWAKGVYYIHIWTPKGTATEKLIVE